MSFAVPGAAAMVSQPYSAKILSAVSQSPTENPSVEIDKDTSHNAASCMIAILCNRLATAAKIPTNVGRTTFHWDGGIINIRNAVKPHFWTNLRVNWAKEFHASVGSRPAVFLMAYWQPGKGILHVWAVPEPVMFDALPRLPVGKIKEKRSVEIKTNAHRFEKCEASPDLQPYYRPLELTPAELDVVNEGHKTDKQVKRQRKGEVDGNSSVIDDGLHFA